MGELIVGKPKQEMDQLSSVGQLERMCGPFLDEFQYLNGDFTPAPWRDAAITYLREKKASGELRQLVMNLETLQTPATRREIGNHLATLAAVYPNAAKSDLSVYGAVLLEDVAAMHPSQYAIECACRKLRQTMRFLPTIAEILEAVGQEERELRLCLRCFKEDVPKLLAPEEATTECPNAKSCRTYGLDCACLADGRARTRNRVAG